MHTHFKHLLLRRYLLAFGSLFDNMIITREDSSGNEAYRQVVPLEYGPKERWLVRLTQDPDFLKSVGEVVPRMSYEISSLTYDATRKINTLDKLTFPSAEAGNRARMYVGVPYNIGIKLSVLVKLQQDGMQIVEQILPYFTPDYTIAIRPLDELPQLVDTIPITLQSVSQSDKYEGNFETRRVIIWELDFTIKAFFYGPVRTQKRVQEVIVNLYNSTQADLAAPLTQEYSLPVVTIDVVADPTDQEPATVEDITAVTTITENWSGISPSISRSLSPSASISPSASPSPSA